MFMMRVLKDIIIKKESYLAIGIIGIIKILHIDLLRIGAYKKIDMCTYLQKKKIVVFMLMHYCIHIKLIVCWIGRSIIMKRKKKAIYVTMFFYCTFLKTILLLVRLWLFDCNAINCNFHDNNCLVQLPLLIVKQISRKL